MVKVEVNGEDVLYVWFRWRSTERMYSMCGAGRGQQRGCTVCVVQVEVNGEDVQYVWCRERLTERVYSMCGSGRG